MDVLTDVLNTLKLKGWLSSRTEIAPPWRFDFDASPDIIFHTLSFGNGYLYIEDENTPIYIENGDVVVFPYGHAHTICNALTSPLTQKVQLNYNEHCEFQVFPLGGQGQKIVMLCGAFQLENSGNHPLLQCLPKVIHIPGKQGSMAEGFTDIVNFIARESVSQQAGSEVMLRRLTEMLFIQVIRIWIEQQVPGNGGWLAALRDQSISTALGLIHQSPERRWKVEELAEAVSLSRSAFSSRFTNLVGEPPIKYLTRWRIQKAIDLLKNNVKIDQIALQLGYESEVAFRKAFKREVGVPPAQYRQAN